MLGFYTPILILQVLCAYHAYRKHAEPRWYWFILLLPVVGCILYIFHHFGSRTNINAVAESVKVVTNSNYQIEQLEQDVKHSDNVSNRINLADAYLDAGRYEEAINLYLQCLSGFMADDPVVRMKLVQAYYLKGDYAAVIEYGKLLENEKSFQQAEERIAYAWADFFMGNVEKAALAFKSMDRSFTNYSHRLEYCRFLEKTNQPQQMKEKLKEIVEELETMRGNEKRLYRPILNQFRELQYNLAKT